MFYNKQYKNKKEIKLVQHANVTKQNIFCDLFVLSYGFKGTIFKMGRTTIKQRARTVGMFVSDLFLRQLFSL